MRETEKSVRTVLMDVYESRRYKLLSVKPYIVLYKADIAAIYQIRHLCQPEQWVRVHPWQRAEWSGMIKDGKCSNCKRKFDTKFELVAKMTEHKDKLQRSVRVYEN